MPRGGKLPIPTATGAYVLGTKHGTHCPSRLRGASRGVFGDHRDKPSNLEPPDTPAKQKSMRQTGILTISSAVQPEKQPRNASSPSIRPIDQIKQKQKPHPSRKTHAFDVGFKLSPGTRKGTPPPSLRQTPLPKDPTHRGLSPRIARDRALLLLCPPCPLACPCRAPAPPRP